MQLKLTQLSHVLNGQLFHHWMTQLTTQVPTNRIKKVHENNTENLKTAKISMRFYSKNIHSNLKKKQKKNNNRISSYMDSQFKNILRARITQSTVSRAILSGLTFWWVVSHQTAAVQNCGGVSSACLVYEFHRPA